MAFNCIYNQICHLTNLLSFKSEGIWRFKKSFRATWSNNMQLQKKNLLRLSDCENYAEQALKTRLSRKHESEKSLFIFVFWDSFHSLWQVSDSYSPGEKLIITFKTFSFTRRRVCTNFDLQFPQGLFLGWKRYSLAFAIKISEMPATTPWRCDIYCWFP